MYKLEYEFLTWTSFPSSLKAINDENLLRGWWKIFDKLPVTPSSRVRVEINIKTDNILTPYPGRPEIEWGSYITIYGFDGEKWRPTDLAAPDPWTTCGAYGKTDWTKYEKEIVIPSDIRMLQGRLVAAKGLTWFDDLKIYQDDKLIYSNYFSNWNPYLGALGGGLLGTIGGYLAKPKEPLIPAVAGLCLGSLFGAGVGLATVLVKK